jgi:hypothetical protein
MSSIPHHLATVLATLRTAITAIVGGLVRRDPAHAPMIQLLWNRIGRAVDRVARLHALWQQGRLPPTRPSRAGIARAPRPVPARLPSRRAWLVALGGHQVASVGAQLGAFLERPEFAAFLAAVPRAGRHLRPLCTMLGVTPPPALRLPPRPPRRRPARPVRPPAPGSRAALAAIPSDRPLQPYVLAAVRAWRRKST